jgi:glycosyltransferase involved in cell wall biosynthesis
MDAHPAEKPRAAMDITVGICTWNRCDLLRQVLEHLCALEQPDGASWEVLVVDNNSTDGTQAVLREFERRLPLRSVFEPKPGKSNAANRLVAEARGDFIVWTDDDVLVDPAWLRAYAAAFARHPDAAIFGGPIRPWFPNQPPPWLERGFHVVETAYASLDQGPEELALTADGHPYGANMALRRAVHLRRPFNPALGPRPNSGLRGEEALLLRELFALGEIGFWVPEASVRHYVPPARQTLRFLREYYLGAGQAAAMLTPAQGSPRFAGRPLWLWRRAIQHSLEYWLRRAFGEPGEWLLHYREALIAWGHLRWHGSRLDGA